MTKYQGKNLNYTYNNTNIIFISLIKSLDFYSYVQENNKNPNSTKFKSQNLLAEEKEDKMLIVNCFIINKLGPKMKLA